MTPIARIAVRGHSRGHGHSAAAAWAYRAGRCFVCARTGQKHDYRPRSARAEIVETGLAWSNELTAMPALARDEQQLLDAIEHAERRCDAKILRDIQVALPMGLGMGVLIELVREYAQWVADEYHTLVMWAIHRPGRAGDARNLHAHILVPTRQLDVSGETFGPKLRVLDDWKTGPVEVCKIRNHWCESVNRQLEHAGVEARIHAGRRLDAPPMPTIPARFVAREYTAKRAAGLASEPMRVGELAALGKPQNPAMARIAAHVEAGHDVPAAERVYEEKARPYYDRAREFDAAERDATYYAGLPIVREELEAAHAELDALESRIEALGEANASGPMAPEPVVVVPDRPVLAPPWLENDGEALESELDRAVEKVERVYKNLEWIETKIARELRDPDWFAATIEESMRLAVGDAPGWQPRLPDVTRRAETNDFGVRVWRVQLGAEMAVLRECGNDRERIEQHIEAVRERAKMDAAWRNRIVSGIGGDISPMYMRDLFDAGYFDPEPAKEEAEDALLERWFRQGAGGGLNAWSEQTIAREAGLEVDFGFGDWSRARDSGLLAEDLLRLHLHDTVRAARRLNLVFPGVGDPGPGAPPTLREWHRRLAGLVSGVRERLRDPNTRQHLLTDLGSRMLPDLRAEIAARGEAGARGPTPDAAPDPAERDRTLRELARARARKAGIDDALENPDRARLRRELDERLEDMLGHVCQLEPGEGHKIASLSPDGVPELGKTAHALDAELARRFRPALERIRAHTGTERDLEHTMRELERCREYVSDPTNRRRVVDALVAAAGAHYEAEWLPGLESEDRRGAREREELRAELEQRLLASAEFAGEALILTHAGVRVESPLRGVAALGKYVDDGGFVEGIRLWRAEREPVRNAVERWREHCATHRDEIASMLLEAMWPEYWNHYRKYRRRFVVERVPTREERDQTILDATEPLAPGRAQRPRGRDPEQGPGY